MLKCRPPQNRDPLEAEIAACEPHLFRQIELVRPRVVATLGNFATKLLSGRSFGITRVHGQEHEVTLASTTVLLYPLYHPAAALYTPSMLKALEDDFARLPALLGHATVTPVAPRAARRPESLRVRATIPSRADADRRARSAPFSSASSEPRDRADHASRRPRPRRSAARSPACFGPVTSSCSGASSARARRRSCAAPAGRSGSRSR